jgi:hypothetical protein
MKQNVSSVPELFAQQVEEATKNLMVLFERMSSPARGRVIMELRNRSSYLRSEIKEDRNKAQAKFENRVRDLLARSTIPHLDLSDRYNLRVTLHNGSEFAIYFNRKSISVEGHCWNGVDEVYYRRRVMVPEKTTVKQFDKKLRAACQSIFNECATVEIVEG